METFIFITIQAHIMNDKEKFEKNIKIDLL